MHAFLYDEGIVRFCTEDYQKAEQSNFKNLYKHLTNSCINKYSKNYVHDAPAEDIFKPNNATTRTLSAFYAELEQ